MECLVQQNSSIGPIWPPQPSSFERLRAFYIDGVITSQAESDKFMECVYNAVEYMNDSNLISRVSIRTIVELGSLARLCSDKIATVEAVLPIADTDLGVAYVGVNASNRLMGAAYIEPHLGLLGNALTRERHTLHPSANMQVVDHSQASELAESFAPLYSMFGYSLSETEELLNNAANTIVFAEINDEVASTAIAEKGSVAIQGFGNLNLVEITEASTRPEYRRQGLYASVSEHLIKRLVSMRQDDPSSIDIIYGESNLAMPGVIYAAHTNGRHFSHYDRDTLNISNQAFGILPQNFKVNDGVETRAYNDFAVSYIPL